jgi:L-cysteate sulfo-lyase
VAGFAALSVDIPILGFGVRAPKAKQEENVFNLARRHRRDHRRGRPVKREMVVADCDYVGEGYGLVDQGGDRRPDPGGPHRGPAAGPGLFGQGDEGSDRPGPQGRVQGRAVVFLHTGGAQGLFGYRARSGLRCRDARASLS